MINTFSTLSSLSLKSKPSPPPLPPTDFTVTTSASFATLNFTAPAGATSYTVTATPTTNTHEIVVSRTFSSGSGYKLEVLNSQTTYTFSLVAKNASGSSTAVTASATTKAATIQASPTITSTSKDFNFLSASSAFYYSYLACPKTTPDIIYASTYQGLSPTLRLFYSTDAGVNFTDITTKLKWNDGYNNLESIKPDTIAAGVVCSDDGRYVHFQPFYRYLNISTDYGSTFNYTPTAHVNSTAHNGLSTSPNGQIIMLVGYGGTPPYPSSPRPNSYLVHWTNNYNSTYTFRNIGNGNGTTALNTSTNFVYYSDGAILHYYNAGANLLTFNFRAVTFTQYNAGSTIGVIASKGNITLVGCLNSPKLRISTNGSNFSNVTAFSTGTGNIAANITMNLQSWIIIEPYVGFIMVGDRESTSRIFYSRDSGSTWQQLTSPSIKNASGATCVLRDSHLVVNITGTNDVAPYLTTFYTIKFSVDIAA
jgi:hypothetical protein